MLHITTVIHILLAQHITIVGSKRNSKNTNNNTNTTLYTNAHIVLPLSETINRFRIANDRWRQYCSHVYTTYTNNTYTPSNNDNSMYTYNSSNSSSNSSSKVDKVLNKKPVSDQVPLSRR